MEIETTSTSRQTADVSPIVLRDTGRVRLVFLPTIVTNKAVPDACVRGQFVYQRKQAKGAWEPLTTESLGALKTGEGYKLELHSGELLSLLQAVGPLYRLYRQQGIPRGQMKFVKVEAGLARFMALGEAELAAFLESHSEDAASTLVKLVRWMGSSATGTAAASRLAALQPEQLPEITALLGMASVKGALAYWRANRENVSEEFWQTALSEHAYVLSQVFAYPMVIIDEKAYVGGKRLTNTGGKVVDFLGAVESTDALVLIEIKTPATRLLGPPYRGVFPLSNEMSGALVQTATYRQNLMRDYHSLTAGRSHQTTLGEPRCLVIAGEASRELTSPERRESFELQRERLQGVTVVTYDELFRKLERLITLLEGA